MNKYDKYALNDFLKDKDFIQHIFYSTKSSISFWEDCIMKYPHQKDNICRATEILNSIELNRPEASQSEIDRLFININEKYRVRKKKLRVFKILSLAAAITLICFFSTIVIRFVHNSNTTPDKYQVEHVSKIDKVSEVKLVMGKNTLVFANNTDIVVENGQVKVQEKEKETSYIANTTSSTEINKLIVPYGKRSSLKLPDGSKLWINSGSTVSFPSNFATNRHIEVDGEVFIDVSRNEEYPFLIKCSSVQIKVLGTQFNVSAYSTDKTESVTLVRGQVEVSATKNKNKIHLNPGEKYTLSDNNINISKVDIYSHISWKDGILCFEADKLSSITARLSRYYNINICCNKAFAEKTCTGKLVLFDDLNETLNTLSDIFNVKYIIYNDKIEIIPNNLK